MTSDASWAWFAGLFEGEGSISDANVNSVRLGIESTDHDVLLRAQEIAGGRLYGPYGPSGLGVKTKWQWRACRAEEVLSILRSIEPYVCKRRLGRIKEARERLANITSRKLYKPRSSGS